MSVILSKILSVSILDRPIEFQRKYG